MIDITIPVTLCAHYHRQFTVMASASIIAAADPSAIVAERAIRNMTKKDEDDAQMEGKRSRRQSIAAAKVAPEANGVTNQILQKTTPLVTFMAVLEP